MKRFRREKSVLGLDIGSQLIKLVEVKQTQKEPIITYAQSKEIPQPEDDDEPASDEAIQGALQELINESKMHKKRVITAVPSALGEQVWMQSIFVPDLPIDAPKSVMEISIRAEVEAQDFIAFLDDAQIDFHVEREAKLDGQNGLEVFVVAVHHDLIENRIQLLKNCGLVPIAIDVDFLAVARLIAIVTQLSEEDDIAILDIGGKKTAVGFYQHGKLHPYPHVSFGSGHRTFEVAQSMQVWDAIEAILDGELAQELYDRFDVYEREFPEFKPAKAILSGGASQFPQMNEFLASRLSIPIDLLHYLDHISVDPNGEVDALKGNEQLFSTAIGLAIKSL